MRLPFIIFMTAALPGVASSLERPPSFPKSTLYEEARRSLTALGWQPASGMKGCSIGREDVCDTFPETDYCSGTGLARCSFLWRKDGSLIEAGTVGEEA